MNPLNLLFSREASMSFRILLKLSAIAIVMSSCGGCA
jgi:hypothetical protein